MAAFGDPIVFATIEFLFNDGHKMIAFLKSYSLIKTELKHDYTEICRLKCNT